jgi:hypothetical protein
VNQDQLEDVRADIYAEPWKDPQLFPDLLHKAITELSQLATYEHSTDPATAGGLQLADGFRFVPTPGAIWWASDLLRALQDRARSGVPFDEPSYGDLGPTNPKDA